MAKDERIFRITKQGYRRTTIQYKSRTAVSAMFAGGYSYGKGNRPDILKVEAIDPVEVEWEDVTDEFKNKPEPRCAWHKTYTGVRKPTVWDWDHNAPYKGWHDCKCTGIYLDKHPDYPRHDSLCSTEYADPATCSCRVITKLCE